MNSVTGESMLQITVDQLARTLCASAVLGAPVEAGERVIIPVAEFGFGFGGGEGTGGETAGKQSGGSGTGGGGGIAAVALIIVTKGVPGPEGIQVISLKKKSEIAEVITTLGETVGPHVAKALEKGSEMMMQRTGKPPRAPEEGKEIPVSGEEEA
ncbi:spore germination protein GerW family protein [Methanoculleus sp. 10]|uniref:spore germination protein GerW family protein n=1 Tax=Methanoculleus sp. 10 TaxID=430615 RepID=UPI0025E2A629|nr:spore germination protein GerW family protein [Methanoculleus sp. 10]